ncbi:MAG: hypothetical protein ACLQFR_05810 [Streptosporangiaceae bacterium]
MDQQAGPVVVSVRRRLDGMPLAIALAAARPFPDITDALGGPPGSLVPRLDVQLKAVNRQGQAPSRDGIQCRAAGGRGLARILCR